MAWNGMDYKDNLQNDGPSKAQILQDRQRLRVMDIYKQSCELKFSRVQKNRSIRFLWLVSCMSIVPMCIYIYMS